MCSAVKSLTRVEEISKMAEVRVPTGFAFAADPDLDLEKLGPHEMKSAYRISKTGLHSRFNDPSCRTNCRDQPGCLTFLGEDSWFVEKEEEEEEPEPRVRKMGEPAGLRNLGNTCYINSLLQIWFHNSTFRQAIYDWKEEEEDQAEEEGKVAASLQRLFAKMEFTRRKFVDPREFISQLGINPGIQQDAQEFSKLFISLLEESLSHQRTDSVRTMVESQFRGEYTYVTTCLNCNQQSARSSQFYELDLALENNNSLQECLDDFTKVEKMTGEEKYHCDHCDSKQEATRACRLTELPPVLNLQLNRFRYDLELGRKKKINTEIDFPLELEMALYHEGPSTLYSLAAVLLHVGQQAHHGHYVAHIKERGSWFLFNDEKVYCMEKKVGPQRSQHAYMLVYIKKEEQEQRLKEVWVKSLRENLVEQEDSEDDVEVGKAALYQVRSVPDNFPAHLKDVVQEDLFEMLAEAAAREREKAETKMLLEGQQLKIREDYRQLHLDEDDVEEERFEFLPLVWLRRWLTDPVDCGHIETSDLLCLHGQLHLEKLHEVKLCREETAEQLYGEYGDGAGPRLNRDSLCRLCVVTKARRVSHQFRVARDQLLLARETPVDGRGFWVGRRSLARWKILARRQLENKIQQDEDEFLRRKTDLTRRRKRKATMDCFEKTREKLQRSGCSVTISFAAENVIGADICDTAGLKIIGSQDQPFVFGQPVEPLTESDDHTKTAPDVENQQKMKNEEDEEDKVFNEELLCVHGNLKLRTGKDSRKLISHEAWSRISSYFSKSVSFQFGMSVCSICQEQRSQYREAANTHKSRLPHLFMGSHRPSLSHPGCPSVFLVPATFVMAWRAFVRGDSGELVSHVNNRSLLCAHKGFLHKLALYVDANKVLVKVSQEEWTIIKELFTVDVEIKVEREAGVSGSELNISPSPCTICMTSRVEESPTIESSLTVRRIGTSGEFRRHRGLRGIYWRWLEL